jgi:hypothetical protein
LLQEWKDKFEQAFPVSEEWTKFEHKHFESFKAELVYALFIGTSQAHEFIEGHSMQTTQSASTTKYTSFLDMANKVRLDQYYNLSFM